MSQSSQGDAVVLPPPVRIQARKGFWRETIESLAVALVIFFLVRTFAFQAFRIPTGSMEKTLLPGDFLFVNKFAYGAKLPFLDIRLPGYSEAKAGDIIVFQFPEDPKQDYIKRCVATEGQTVEIREKRVYIDGVLKEEPYAVFADTRVYPLGRGPAGMPERDNMRPRKVPPHHLFMMGDNRDASYDSRGWGFVDLRLVRGKAWITYFSWDKSRNLPRFGRMFRWIR